MSQLGGSVPGTKRYKKEKKGLPSVTKKQKESDEKKAWLKKTRNSAAARSGAFSDDERWALQQKHRASQAARKKKKAAPKAQPKKTSVKPGSRKGKVFGGKGSGSFTDRGGVAGWVKRKGGRLRDKLKVAGSAFRKG